MTTVTELEIQLFALDLVAECVEECGENGAPAGYLYAVLMHHGCTHEQFEQMMSVLVTAGRLRKQGDVYYGTSNKEREPC
jgi:hypothetical protein